MKVETNTTAITLQQRKHYEATGLLIHLVQIGSSTTQAIRFLLLLTADGLADEAGLVDSFFARILADTLTGAQILAGGRCVVSCWPSPGAALSLRSSGVPARVDSPSDTSGVGTRVVVADGAVDSSDTSDSALDATRRCARLVPDLLGDGVSAGILLASVPGRSDREEGEGIASSALGGVRDTFSSSLGTAADVVASG